MPNNQVKSIRPIISDAEHKCAETEGKMREMLDELLAQIPELEANQADAERLPKEIEASWAKGDATYSSDDLMKAEADERRCKALTKGVKSKAQGLERRLSTEDKAVAEALVPHIEKAIMGATVVATNAPEKYWGDIPKSTTVRPAVVLVQESDTVVNSKTGAMSAKVYAYYFRYRGIEMLSQRNIEKALENLEGHVSVGYVGTSFSSDDDYFTDKAHLVVDAIWPMDIPVISVLELDDAKTLANRLLSDMCSIPLEVGQRLGNGNVYGNKAEWNDGVLECSGYSMRTMAPTPKVTIDIQGNTRTLTVSGVINVTGRNSNVGSYGVADVYSLCDEAFAAEAKQLMGSIAPGLGHCESFTVTKGFNETQGAGVPFRFTGVYVSELA